MVLESYEERCFCWYPGFGCKSGFFFIALTKSIWIEIKRLRYCGFTRNPYFSLESLRCSIPDPLTLLLRPRLLLKNECYVCYCASIVVKLDSSLLSGKHANPLIVFRRGAYAS